MIFRVLYTAYMMPDGGTDAAKVFEGLFDDCVIPIHECLEQLSPDDVVLFDGGVDVNPQLYGEVAHPFTQTLNRERDNWERTVFRRAQAVGAACIGICRGAQLLTVLSGAQLIQHVTDHGMRTHEILTDDDRRMMATGDHHQMMHPYNAFHHLIAWAEGHGQSFCEYGKDFVDGKEPEIVWYPDTRSLCIQPHPEWMVQSMVFPAYCRELVKRYIFLEPE